MCQLQTDEQITIGSGRVAVFFDERSPKSGETLLCVVGNDELIWVRPASVRDCHGFPTPNQFGSAATEVPPAMKRSLAGAPVCRSVPALHRLRGEAIADLEQTFV
jgi:hypothetical protein